MLERLKEMRKIVKEFIGLVNDLNELSIRIISLVGWIVILAYVIMK